MQRRPPDAAAGVESTGARVSLRLITVRRRKHDPAPTSPRGWHRPAVGLAVHVVELGDAEA